MNDDPLWFQIVATIASLAAAYITITGADIVAQWGANGRDWRIGVAALVVIVLVLATILLLAGAVAVWL